MKDAFKTVLAGVCALAAIACPLVGYGNGEYTCQGPGTNNNGGGGGNTNTSHDPNEMAGPAGVGEKRYVKAGDWMDYTIYFENATNATAAAINITVTLPKDASLDWSTLELGELAFGDHTDTGFVDDKATRSIKYALSDSGCEVRTIVTESDGDVTWNLRIWDPTTGDHYPDDFKKGVLPPNDPDTHCGEGHISYRVKLRENAVPGNVVHAFASIVFEDNPAIITDPAWSNTVAQVASVKVNGDVEGAVADCDLIVGMPYGALPMPKAQAGYTFGGWFTGPNGTGRRVTAESLVQSGDSGIYAHWTANAYTVTFDDNGGTGGWRRSMDYGTAIVAPAVTRTGYDFAGWQPSLLATVPASNVTFTAVWTAIPPPSPPAPDPDPVQTQWVWTVSFDANGGALAGEDARPAMVVTNGCAIGELPSATREGYTFDGWFTAADSGSRVSGGLVVTASMTLFAHWTASPSEASETPVLWEDEAVTGAVLPSDAVPSGAASVYDGYIYNKATRALAGTIQVKVGKPKLDKRTQTLSVSVKATVIGLDGKKKSLKAGGKGKAPIASDGPTTVELAGGEVCEVALGGKRMSGSYGDYAIDGARNVFTSKDAADKAVASSVLGEWKGAVNVAWRRRVEDNAPYQTLTVSIANKGKAKVSGTLADGTKVSASGQLIVGDEWCCVPVVVSKKTRMAFTLWLPRTRGSASRPCVAGLGDGVVVGKPGTLKGGAAFHIDADAFAARWGHRALPYLPDGVRVAANGAKWVVADGAKAGKVVYKKGTTEVDDSKTGANPSALKLSCKAKDGTFKGSFKAHSDVNGKPKATKVDVTGVLIDGVGYGAATVKKVDGVAVTVE